MPSIAMQASKSIWRVTLGALVATVAVYGWGVLFRQVLPFKIITSAYDKEALIRFLEVEFPQSGTYTLPMPDDNAEAVKELFEVGPVATVHVLGSGDISLRTKIPLVRIVQTFITVFLLGWILWIACPAMDSYRLRVAFVALMGFAAAIYNDLADPVWAYHPWRWIMAKALYHITSWTIAGFLLSINWVIGFGLSERRRRMLAQG